MWMLQNCQDANKPVKPESSDITFHCVSPGIHFSPGNSEDTSASSKAPTDPKDFLKITHSHN